ncbi:hypothetical protein G7069_08755 [Lysobacter sp. HDW10]|uniref:hypothetical protein n=1 Tax=Lysobacter sp. HDW10 TaxID=2714936 RepID=UPI00140AE06C|nr:hypothetical protein [Lysobacter sp. HDW10]QIK81675.1 hypothetical protein G7069_08755 [Lysobacter sp. HDW10]
MNKFQKAKLAVAKAGAAVTGLAAAGMASAQSTGLSTAFSAGVDKSELMVIGGIVLGVCGVIFLIRSARRAG